MTVCHLINQFHGLQQSEIVTALSDKIRGWNVWVWKVRYGDGKKLLGAMGA